MSEGNDKDRLIPFSGIVVVLAALGVIIFSREPLKGGRPAVPAVHEQQRKIAARLWQDPFEAVLHEGKRRTLAGHANFSLYTSFTRGEKGSGESKLKTAVLDQRKKGKVAVVGVMEPGGSYAEPGEFRLRHRYAILAGLRRLGFVPRSPDTIDFVHLCTDDEPCPEYVEKEQLHISNVMPFEWLDNDNEAHREDSVLLLWLNDDVFQENPLSKLRQVARLVGASEQPSPSPAPEELPSFKVIGPANSTTLREMLKEMRNIDPGKDSKHIEIYSAMASVDSARLLELFGDSPIGRKPAIALDNKFNERGYKFRRTACSDRELAQSIFDELKLRHVNFSNPRNHLVLVSEWDTYYGQSLPEIYKEVFFTGGVAGVERQLHKFSYLRGVDGALPVEKGDDPGKEQDKRAPSGNKESEALEHPVGHSQVDYLRRLADEIYRLDQNLGAGSIRAIGVLGNDFYDKYLVLQALRQRFPQAIFFTTDLDARLLHPEAIPSTRNMIVASTFNLALRPDSGLSMQGDVPPFRDSNQTALFFSVLQAFVMEDYLEPRARDAVLQELHPRIFELGRYSAIDLSGNAMGARNLHPEQQLTQVNGKYLRKFLMIVVLLVPLFAFSSEKMRVGLATAFSGKKGIVITTVALVLLGVALSLFYKKILLHPESEEPFLLLEGVSVWPAEIFRLISVFLSIFFIWWGHRSLKKNDKEIKKRFRLRQVPERPDEQLAEDNNKENKTGIVEDVQTLLGEFSEVVRYDWEVPGRKGYPLTMDDYWSEYRRRNSFRYRIRRLVPIIVTFMALSAYLISFCRPVPPLRGDATAILDRTLVALSVLSFNALIFYAFDVIRTCRRLIDLVSRQAPIWSSRSMKGAVGGCLPRSEVALQEWMLVRLIAVRTDIVGRLVFYPFIVWLILFISRLEYFDNWHTPVGLVIVITIGAIYPWSCAIVLRRAAERARTGALRRLEVRQVCVYSQHNPDEHEKKRLEMVTDLVRSVKEGAFAPFVQNPVVQALIVPFGGVGGVYAIDFLNKLNV